MSVEIFFQLRWEGGDATLSLGRWKGRRGSRYVTVIVSPPIQRRSGRFKCYSKGEVEELLEAAAALAMLARGWPQGKTAQLQPQLREKLGRRSFTIRVLHFRPC